MVEISAHPRQDGDPGQVSVLYREPMWLKSHISSTSGDLISDVSVLYREPMWLKCINQITYVSVNHEFQCSTVSRCG